MLFDLDGTLTDPKVGITLSMQHALAVVGVTIDDPDELTWCIGPPIIDNFARLGVMGDRAVSAIAAYRERYDAVGAFENEVFDGIPELLDALVADGRRLAVATSKAETAARKILEHFDLRDRFEVVAGASEDHVRSVKADIVAYAIDQLRQAGADGLDPPSPGSAVLVGDRRHDIVGAQVAGIGSIAVTWGYAEDGELEAAGPDRTVSTVAELADVLGLRRPRG